MCDCFWTIITTVLINWKKFILKKVKKTKKNKISKKMKKKNRYGVYHFPLIAWTRSWSHNFSSYCIFWIFVVQPYCQFSLCACLKLRVPLPKRKGRERKGKGKGKREGKGKGRKGNKKAENGYWRNSKSNCLIQWGYFSVEEIHIKWKIHSKGDQNLGDR